jgi:hypothetical protein
MLTRDTFDVSENLTRFQLTCPKTVGEIYTRWIFARDRSLNAAEISVALSWHRFCIKGL